MSIAHAIQHLKSARNRHRRPALIAPQPIAKGVCSKCGKHIGRGVRFHEKACGNQIRSQG